MDVSSTHIRQVFLDFFRDRGHRIVSSAPMVVKDDPTLMFTNAGMNQFKDIFLGNKAPLAPRVADTQRCLRVSGKHNDLEEVGKDSYHHTMFEMLGNWSFGDYFKEDAIAWAWELLTEVYGLEKGRLYVTVFGGDENEGLDADEEARNFWGKWIASERILDFGKADNFWEMGDSGPCGPCSEIHYDLRDDDSRRARDGRTLVNAGDPSVIEIWNLVFIQYNRKADGSLDVLPSKHVDTGMGFERLTRVLQKKSSNYDTDIFEPYIHFIAQATGIPYTGDYTGTSGSDTAMRVIADHVRALFFGIADGQLPSNTGAGYVLRRILRRAVRYAYSFLHVRSPILYRLVPLVKTYFDGVFPDAAGQADFIAKVIQEEEQSFLRTLEAGLKRFETLQPENRTISGTDVFELYDTYGFPPDLTRLLAEERDLTVDMAGFQQALEMQRSRSREDAQRALGDWVVLIEGQPEFVGYDRHIVEDARILRYRRVDVKNKTQYHLVLNTSPFYPEGGGQVGDTGTLKSGDRTIEIVDTIRENDLPVLVATRLPEDLEGTWKAEIDSVKREQTEFNHSATHLLHAALRRVLGTHVQQKGSLVAPGYLRFDFSHFQKMSVEEIRRVEEMVNARIRENIARKEDRAIPIDEARKAGAMMLFGEKYGDVVRMITFDPEFSVELCGGCHVKRTGDIGLFKITSETAVAAGVRRIEAVTAKAAEDFIQQKLDLLDELSEILKRPSDLMGSVRHLLDENKQLRKALEEVMQGQVSALVSELSRHAEGIGDLSFIASPVSLSDGKALKDLVFRLTSSETNRVVLIVAESEGKVQIHLGISKALAGNVLDAGKMIRELAKFVRGGGGGQPFYGSAGGNDPSGIQDMIAKAKEMVREAAHVSS